MDIVSMLPWWGGVALALMSYVVLHGLATPVKAAAQPAQLDQIVMQSMVAAFAMVGQYIVPMLCLFAALGSFLRRSKREGLAGQVAGSQSAEALHGMSWKEFEVLVGEAFRLQGYTVTEVGGGGADGGVDLVVRKGTETALVQCKQWKATQVGVQVVRELFGVMAARGAAAGFVVTSGDFTADARAFVQGRNISLVNGSRLIGLIRQAKGSLAASRSSSSVAKGSETWGRAPQCPKCSASMVRRTAQKGAKAGSQFWGCSNFPKCYGSR
jgi:restriction system protein